jgi:hypothetical protein
MDFKTTSHVQSLVWQFKKNIHLFTLKLEYEQNEQSQQAFHRQRAGRQVGSK